MGFEKEFILMGAGTVLVGDPGAEENVGYTRDGITFSKDADFHETVVDQHLDLVRIFRVATTYTVTFNLLQATLANIKLAWGEVGGVEDLGGTSQKLILGSGSTTTVPEKSFIFYGAGPAKVAGGEDRKRKISLPRVISIDYGDINYNRDGESLIPVTLRALKDEDLGFVGLIEDIPGTYNYTDY